MAGKLDSAVAKFDKALEDVRAEIAAQRQAVDEASAHVEEAVASFDADSGTVVPQETPDAEPAPVEVVEEPVTQPPVV